MEKKIMNKKDHKKVLMKSKSKNPKNIFLFQMKKNNQKKKKITKIIKITNNYNSSY